jgi:hypothetical protein
MGLQIHRVLRCLAAAAVLTLAACGRTLRVQIVDDVSGAPIAGARVAHGRAEWRMMGILPVQSEIIQGSGATDAEGYTSFADVRDGDTLTVTEGTAGGIADRTWFGPLYPVTQTRSGDTTAAEKYSHINATQPADRLVLPVSRRSDAQPSPAESR